MRVWWVLLVGGLAISGCTLVDQTTFARAPEADVPQLPPPKVDPRTPLLIIGYDTEYPSYQEMLRFAVRTAESRAPGVQYDVIATLPGGRNPALGQSTAVDVMRSILAQGVPEARIHLGLRDEADRAPREVRIYVR